MSEFVPFRSNPISSIRPEDEKTFDDLTNTDPVSETTSGSSSHSIPRRQPPAPIPPVMHENTTGDAPQQERREWRQATQEAAPPPAPTPAPNFDFDLHGRLEEAFGAPTPETAPTSAFDAVVERDLAEDHQAAPEPQATPTMVEPQAPFQDPVVETPPVSADTKPTSFWNEPLREEPRPAAPPPAAAIAAAAPTVVAEQPAPARIFKPEPSPVPETPAAVVSTPAAVPTETDINLDLEIASELERAMGDELYLTPDEPPVQAGVEATPTISPQRAAETIAPLPEPGDPFAKELEKLLATPAGDASAADASAPQPPQFRSPSFGETNLYGDMPTGEGKTDDEARFFAAFAENNSAKSRTRTVALAVIGVALLGGVAAFALNFFESDPGEIPVITAETDAVKERPTETGGEEVPNQNQAVYDEVEGTGDTDVSQERLNGEPEEPIQVSTAPVSGNQETLLQPRTVRTVTVRPDGTIVSRDGQAPTPQELEPVSITPITSPTLGITPAPVTPSATSDPSRVVTSVPIVQPDQTAANQAEPSVATPEPAPTVAEATPEPVVETAPEPTVVEPLEVAGTRPTPRPATPPVTVVTPAPTPQPVAQPAPQPVAEAVPSTSSPFAVQISSQRSQAAAQQTYANLSRQYPSVLDGRGVDIRRAEIEGRGVFYRVRIPAQTRNEAITICENLKASGGSCFVTR